MKKVILILLITLILFGGLFIFEYSKFMDGKVHIIFCDVGQGDAILIITPGRKHILIDGGPDRKVLSCLANHLPFWERKIDLMILTHPHADHFMGMFYVVERYVVDQFATEELQNKSGEFSELKKMLNENAIPVKYVSSGDRWVISSDLKDGKNVELSVMGPTKDFLKKTSPSGNITDSGEFASLILQLRYGNFRAFFTGDTQAGELGDIVENIDTTITVLQAPHHGSRTGLNTMILQKLDPRVVILSVGAFNRYGHPSKETLALLRKAKIPFLRTDEAKDIEISVDENKWRIYKNNLSNLGVNDL